MSQVLCAEKEGYQVLKFVGDIRLSVSPAISGYLSRIRELEDCKGIVVDLSDTTAIDSTALGLIAKLGICCRETFDRTLSIVSPREDIRRLLLSMAMEEVSVITSEPLTGCAALEELTGEDGSEEVLLRDVLEAHKTLMSIDADNEIRFKDLVDRLQKEQNDRASSVAKTG